MSSHLIWFHFLDEVDLKQKRKSEDTWEERGEDPSTRYKDDDGGRTYLLRLQFTYTTHHLTLAEKDVF